MKNRIPDTDSPAKSGGRRILVVANGTIGGEGLRDVVGLRVDGEPVEVRVIAPALNSRLRHWLSDEDGARQKAGLRLRSSLEGLLVAGIEAEGRVGDADPLRAIADALYQFDAEQIVIATRPEARSHRLTRDLAARATRQFSLPVVHVVGEPGDDSTLSESTQGRRLRTVNAVRRPSPARVDT